MENLSSSKSKDQDLLISTTSNKTKNRPYDPVSTSNAEKEDFNLLKYIFPQPITPAGVQPLFGRSARPGFLVTEDGHYKGSSSVQPIEQKTWGNRLVNSLPAAVDGFQLGVPWETPNGVTGLRVPQKSVAENYQDSYQWKINRANYIPQTSNLQHSKMKVKNSSGLWYFPEYNHEKVPSVKADQNYEPKATIPSSEWNRPFRYVHEQRYFTNDRYISPASM